jgi:N-ethylmaleimide reductase
VGGLELPNRILMAPMTRSRADETGVVGELTALYYAQRATAGLIISEATNISAMAKGYVRTPGIYTEEQVAAWRTVTQAVHAREGRIFLQIFHTGRVALPDFLPGQAQPVAPSAIRLVGQNYTDEGMKDFVTPRALETEEIAGIVADYRQATAYAFEAGFDGVELHAASGYLPQQFLMTAANRRTDAYGGSLENRARFLLEVLDAMTGVRGAAHIGVKFSPQMPFNGVDEPDADTVYPYLMDALSGRGLAYVHVGRFNATDWHALLRPRYRGLYFAGGGLTRETGESLVASGGADAAVYGSLFVANPDLPARFAQNAPLNAPDPATFYTPGAAGYTDYPTLTDAAGNG